MSKLKILAFTILFFTAILPINLVLAGHLDDIISRGYIRVGSTGDYIPMSYLNPNTGKYEGFDAELSEIIAESLGVKLVYVPTTWPTLATDTINDKFDIALCGISRNYARAKTMAMSDAYGEGIFGKTILCRKSDAGKFKTIADIDKPSVTVMINPGGTNEKFAHANLHHAKLVVYQENAEIPGQIAEGKADIMITETVEAARYIEKDKRLAAPLIKSPFTRHSCGILMAKGDQELLNYVNFVLAELKMDGTLSKLETKYFNIK